MGKSASADHQTLVRAPSATDAVNRDLFGEPIIERPTKGRAKAPVIQFPSPKLAKVAPRDHLPAQPSSQTNITKLDGAAWRSSSGAEIAPFSYLSYAKGPPANSPLLPLLQLAKSEVVRRAARTSLKLALAGIGAISLGADERLHWVQQLPPASVIDRTLHQTVPLPRKRPMTKPSRKTQKQIDDRILEQLKWLERTSTSPASLRYP